MIRNIRQETAKFLEKISIVISPRFSKSQLSNMSRKDLIAALKQEQQRGLELQQSQEDLANQIVEIINDLNRVNEGNLSLRLKVTACFVGSIANSTNLLIDDLSEAIKALPSDHPLTEKYVLKADRDKV